MSTKESEMQYLDAISKTTEWSLFVSKALQQTIRTLREANHNIHHVEEQIACQIISILKIDNNECVYYVLSWKSCVYTLFC